MSDSKFDFAANADSTDRGPTPEGLKLVHHDPLAPLPFNRRRERRRQLRQSATAVLLERGGNDPREGDSVGRVLRLELVDVGAAGLGAIADRDVPVGSMLTVVASPHGAEASPTWTGRVVRRESDAVGVRLGLALHLDHVAA